MAGRSGVRRCFVLNCKSVYCSVQRDGTLFRFPRPGPAWKEWLRLSGDEELLSYPLESLIGGFRICEKHFQPTDIGGNARKRVKPGAVPSIFHTQHRPIAEDTFQKWLQEHPEAEVEALLCALANVAPGKVSIRSVAVPCKGRVRGPSSDVSSNRKVEGIPSEVPTSEAERELRIGELSGCSQSPCTTVPQPENQDEPTTSHAQLDGPASANNENVSVDPPPKETPHCQAPGERQWEFTYMLSTNGSKLIAVPCWAVDLLARVTETIQQEGQHN